MVYGTLQQNHENITDHYIKSLQLGRNKGYVTSNEAINASKKLEDFFKTIKSLSILELSDHIIEEHLKGCVIGVTDTLRSMAATVKELSEQNDEQVKKLCNKMNRFFRRIGLDQMMDSQENEENISVRKDRTRLNPSEQDEIHRRHRIRTKNPDFDLLEDLDADFSGSWW